MRAARYGIPYLLAAGGTRRLKKYILFIDSLNSGGAQRQMVNLAVLMRQRQIPVEIVCYHPINKYRELLEPHGLEPVILGGGSKAKLVLDLRRHIRKTGTTHLIAFLFTPSLLALIVGLLSRGLKVIVGERSFEGNTPTFHRHVTRRFYFRADAITTNSRAQHLALEARFDPAKLHYIPNGIPDSQIVARPEPKSGMKIISIGRVSPLKNVHGLIEALASPDLAASGFEVIWLGDYSEYHDYYVECCDRLDELSLRDRWTWKGVVPDVESYLDQSRALYHGSFGEGFPNAICEGLSRGVPVIASDVYDHSAIIEDGANGFLFEPDDVSALIEKLARLRSLDENEYDRMARAAIETARRNFLVENTLSEYLELV